MPLHEGGEKATLVMYTEFIGNPTGTKFVAAKMDHEFLLNQRSNVTKSQVIQIIVGSSMLLKTLATPSTCKYR